MSALSLNLNNKNTLMFATSAIGDFNIQVAITRLIDTSASTFDGTVITMSEVKMPAGHMRVFLADFTPLQTGSYILSYFGVNELGEVLTHVQRGIVGSSSSGGGGAAATGAIGVGL